jgi:hypothetical protein
MGFAVGRTMWDGPTEGNIAALAEARNRTHNADHTGIVETRSGLFNAGLDAAFRFPGAGRVMLKLPRTWGSATEIPGRKVTSVAPSCLTAAARPAPQRREFPQVMVITVRQAGLEPATRCLEGSRSIRLSYWRSVTIVHGVDHASATLRSQSARVTIIVNIPNGRG